MTELEKCMAGKIYDCHNKTFLYLKEESRRLLREYNALKYEQKEEKREILNRLFGQIGTNVSVGQPFLCDYGVNISLGNNVSINMNCTFVDCNKIEIGDNVLIASNVQLYTATHPVARRIRGILLPYLCPAYSHRRRLLAGRRCYCASWSDNWQRLCDRSRKRSDKGYSRSFVGSRESLPCHP